MKKGLFYLLFVVILSLNVSINFEKKNRDFSLKSLIETAMADPESGGEDCWVYTSWWNIDNYQCVDGCWGGTEEGIDECEGSSGSCESEGYWIFVLDCYNCTVVGCPAGPGTCS